MVSAVSVCYLGVQMVCWSFYIVLYTIVDAKLLQASYKLKYIFALSSTLNIQLYY